MCVCVCGARNEITEERIRRGGRVSRVMPAANQAFIHAKITRLRSRSAAGGRVCVLFNRPRRPRAAARVHIERCRAGLSACRASGSQFGAGGCGLFMRAMRACIAAQIYIGIVRCALGFGIAVCGTRVGDLVLKGFFGWVGGCWVNDCGRSFFCDAGVGQIF